jgi:SPP1 family predicted phage head-tail adaptor
MLNSREGRKTDASEMRHYVVIQDFGSTTDGEGSFDKSWVDGTTVAAAIFPIRAAQVFQYKSVNVDATHIIKIRGEISVYEKLNRIKFGTRTFEILTIEDIQERGVVKIITCKELR